MQGEFYKKNWRWYVLGTLFLATFLNYFNRQTLGTAIDPISKEFGLDNILRGNLLAAFTLTYALTHFFVGAVIDRVRNIRLFFSIMVVGWSVSSLLVAFAQSYSQMMALRYLLGIWEAVNFPVCLLIISRIFPAGERSLASGIFASGAFMATLAAPPVVIFFSNAFNWRYSFVVSGALGFFWLIPWFLIFKKPEIYSEMWVKNTAHLKEVVLNTSFANYLKSYALVLKQPGFWGVSLIGLGIVPCLYFATLWFPTYFTQSLNHPFDQSLSINLSIIYFMQDIGLWVGGGVALYLSRHKLNIMVSRKMVIVGAWLLMMSIILVPMYSSVTSSVILFSLFVLGLGAFLGNQHAFKQDVVTTQVATVSALVGFIETTFTFLVLRKIGVMTNVSHDFSLVFIIMAALSTFALAVVFIFMRPKWIKIN